MSFHWPKLPIATLLVLTLSACSGITTPAAIFDLLQGGSSQPLDAQISAIVDNAEEIVEGARELRDLFPQD